ncbi:lipopolysaccharide transport periplasmic protein LptA [Denitromonas iodatirespirans]|uniref:Lipopolysaccharide export system protein LptA n=1 Tax=Denitromonas iodatirespirans TaxID=2795389 RepID=A0A944DAB5_DENI1|nr:lipopolysaccharide transport periplasmic protein LptA [Denitromonas iodatirespirans]MBT0962690.1 lipopolysaccharide transport periplasmic protein LptA [Denitromonas iodatirespirans]
MNARLCLLALTASLWAGHALAERADRNKPVNIEADKVTVDERKKVHLFEGKVVLTQGTLEIRGDTLTVTQDDEGFQKGVATSQGDGLARFKQKRDGSGDYVHGRAERIEYDGRTQMTHLYVRAHVTSGKDEVQGEFIEYDGYTGQYVVTNSSSKSANGSGRVRAVIQPKTPAPE